MATHFAVFLGRFRVPKRASPKMACLDDLDTWLPKLKRESRKKTSPARMEIADRCLSDALFAVTQHSDEPRRWQAVLLALADTESVMRTGTGFRAGVIPPLRPEWVEAANDDSPEFRLALAFALQSPNDPVRRHWLPLKENQARFAASGTGRQAVLERRPEVVMGGRSGMDDAIAVVLRRIQYAEKTSDDGFSLVPERGASAAPSDLALLLAGRVNFDLTVKLARALMALNRRQWRVNPRPLDTCPDDAYPDDAWLTIRLSLSGFPLPPEDRRVPLDPAIPRRLQSGDAASAVRTALQRLRSVGIRAPVRFAAVSPKTARLWAAALAFPVDKATATGFFRRLTTIS
jgi:CRISPR-associated protein Csx17